MIELKNVTKIYDGNVTGVDHLNLTIEDGEFVFLVGESGSGKSTLVQLIQRLYTATSGHVRLSGVDGNDIERHHLRRSVGLVLQEPFLYSRTIGENIAIARNGTMPADFSVL